MHPPILVEAERLHQEKKFQESAVLYDRILAQNEDNPYILAGLAQNLLRDSRSVGTAIALYLYAIEMFKKKNTKVPVELYSNLGLTYKFSGQMEKAVKWLKKAVDTEPTAAVLCNYGQVFVESDDPTKGRSELERAVKLDATHALAHWNLALSLLCTAREDDGWARAWDEYEWGLHDGAPRERRKNCDLPDWDGTPGKKVLVHGEQGIGDEIMFASMLPDMMKDAEVVLDCHPRLAALFDRSFGVKCYGTRKDRDSDWIAQEKPDALISLGSLGKFYRRRNADFPGTPYLKADPLPREHGRLRVGISWTGGRLAGRVAKRTVPLNWWRSILDNDCEFVSLQYTDGAQPEIESVNKLGYSVRQLPEAQAEDYYETARAVASCDLVITVCTSIVHLAGALGVPCWVMTPQAPAWRYQYRGGMPWYRSVRLYRQMESKADAWIPVVQRVGLDLSDLLAQRAEKAA